MKLVLESVDCDWLFIMVKVNEPWGSVVGGVLMVLMIKLKFVGLDVGVVTLGLILYTLIRLYVEYAE